MINPWGEVVGTCGSDGRDCGGGLGVGGSG